LALHTAIGAAIASDQQHDFAVVADDARQLG